MKIDAGTRVMKLLCCCLLVAVLAAPAQAQFRIQQTFEDATAPGWTFSDSALLTAPSIDAPGTGWLRLTAATGNAKGLALDGGFSFSGNQPVVVEFSYVAWGGTGADGMTLFLYDSSTASPMAGALVGGGLGYCGGAGGYLAIGLDEYGNFSNPFDKCTTGGPGRRAESLVIRGPESASNAWVSTTPVTGGIDNPGVVARPSPKTVLMILTPAVGPAVGYTISAQFQSASGQPFQTLFSNTPFTYVPPTSLSVGFSGGTGGKTNVHELQRLVAATPDDLQVAITGPASVLQGAAVIYGVTVTNNGNFTLDTGNAPTIVDTLPAFVTAATWTCAGAGGANCDPSGSGNINTTNVTLPANGSVTYTITGTLDPAATCGASVANSANADFGATTSFLDPDETNNTATVTSTVTCDTTLVANPASLTYPPQQVGVASGAQAVTLTEGMNSSTLTSIVVTGDYSQTNNCPATLTAAQTCSIAVVFTPTALGSRNGTLTISSNPAASPTITSVVTLSGTGVNTTPSPFSFTPLIDVDPSSLQVSNAITVASTDAPAPISVSAGGQYSINGGPFTAVPGVVSPGAQVRVQLTAASGYLATDAAVLTIGGVSAPFTVTTGAEPVLQGGFTPVTGAMPSSVQTSNAITVTATTLASPISVSSGDEYSINGGPFTAALGMVQPGDQVTVQLIAPSTYNSTASAVVTIGGLTSTFTVTTAAQPAQQAGFTPVTGAGISSSQVSNPITVTSITAPSAISISSGAQYSINGGPFTAAAGTVQPGDQVRVEATASATYETTATAVLTIDGFGLKFLVTTGSQPLQHVAVTGGGGAIDLGLLLMLAIIGALKFVRPRRAARALPLALAVLAAFSGLPARADGENWVSNLYGGIRIGDSTSSMTAAKLTRALQADGYQVTAAGAERGTASGTLYAGYELGDNFAVELGWTYVGRTRAALAGILPAQLSPLLAATAHTVRGSGDIASVEARYRWPLARRIALDLRAGPTVWLTTADVYVSGVDALHRSEHGVGFTLGAGPRFTLGERVGIGVGVDYLQSTSDNHFVVFAATLEYHCR